MYAFRGDESMTHHPGMHTHRRSLMAISSYSVFCICDDDDQDIEVAVRLPEILSEQGILERYVDIGNEMREHCGKQQIFLSMYFTEDKFEYVRPYVIRYSPLDRPEDSPREYFISVTALEAADYRWTEYFDA